MVRKQSFRKTAYQRQTLSRNSKKTFKKSTLDIDKELYKKAKYDASKLITSKKRAFFGEKLSEKIFKPKELWES